MLGHQVERVAQVHAFDRAARSAQLAVAGARKCDRRPVIFFLDSRRDQSDHALVPVLVVKADRAARGDVGIVEHRQRIELHVAFDFAPVAIQLIELARKLDRALEAVGDQTFDADRHVGQPPRCVDARTDCETKIARTRRARIFAGHLKQRGDAGAQPALANPLQPLPDQDAIVAIELDDVRDGAERDEIEQMIEARLRRSVEGLRVRAARLAARAARRTSRRRPPDACSGTRIRPGSD